MVGSLGYGTKSLARNYLRIILICMSALRCSGKRNFWRICPGVMDSLWSIGRRTRQRICPRSWNRFRGIDRTSLWYATRRPLKIISFISLSIILDVLTVIFFQFELKDLDRKYCNKHGESTPTTYSEQTSQAETITKTLASHFNFITHPVEMKETMQVVA